MKKIKALVLLSGGLDSILAAKLLKELGVKVTALCFKSCFFSEETAKIAAKKLKVPFMVVDFSKAHLEMIKNPRYGYGSSVNPCIDCHILMLKSAGDIMRKKSFDFVATGEVLGERPMSQNKRALELIERKSGLSGYLLRPLSAKVLGLTISEKSGLLNRKELFGIYGRSRKIQIAMAKKWKIDWYPAPSGGCILTEKEFGKRLKELSAVNPDFNEKDARLLAFGRHFLFGKTKVVIGRRADENGEIKKLKQKGDIILEMNNYPGPVTLIRNYSGGKIDGDVLEKAKFFTSFYSTKARGKGDIKFKIDF